MANDISRLFSELGYLLGICPNEFCGELMRITDAHPFLKGKRPRSVLDEIEEQEDRLERALERLEEKEQELRETARLLGLKQAKKRLKVIDAVFSASRIDPQDVKVLFDPVEYVVFDGMNDDRLRRVLFLAHPPTSKQSEAALTSMSQAIERGNLEFRTLRVLEDGGLDLK
ncbi:MAG TPA: Holliday junction resolvase-like protein [Rhizomicrobium sp.]